MTTCGYCNSKIDRRWNFCPKCGNKLRTDFTLNELINRQMDYFKKILNMTDYDISIEPQSDNTFVVNISQGFEKETPVFDENTEINNYQDRKKIKQMKLPKNTIEPEVSVKKIRDKILLEMKLPGIKKEEDIELTRLNNSIELRSSNGRIGYFKILKIPAKYRLLSKHMDNEALFLEFS